VSVGLPDGHSFCPGGKVIVSSSKHCFWDVNLASYETSKKTFYIEIIIGYFRFASGFGRRRVFLIFHPSFNGKKDKLEYAALML
jgi:hypothetical protein